LSSAKPTASSGFSLLEVLVAFAIFAAAAVALLQTFSTELDRAGESDRQRAALALAQSKLDTLMLTEPVKDQVHSGEAARGLRWRVSVRRYRDAGISDTSVVMPALVTATVSWADGHAVTLTTLRLAPRQ